MFQLLGGKYVCKTVLNDGHQRTVRDVAWSLNDKLLASASFDGTTAVWDRKEGQFECALTLEGHENEVKAVAWSPSGQYLGKKPLNFQKIKEDSSLEII